MSYPLALLVHRVEQLSILRGEENTTNGRISAIITLTFINIPGENTLTFNIQISTLNGYYKDSKEGGE